MSKDEYYANFPYDVYANEDQPMLWTVQSTVSEVSDSTQETGKFSIAKNPITAGWYKIQASTKDKYGESIQAEKWIYLFSKNNPVTDPIITEISSQALPGLKIQLRS